MGAGADEARRVNWARDDILHSVRRYVVGWLAQPWIIGFERAEVKNDERPRGLIDLGPSRTTRARHGTYPQGPIERAAACTVTLYPEIGATPRAGRRRAEQVAQYLQDLIDFGTHLGYRGDDVTPEYEGRPKAGPYRIPLFDYAAATPPEDADPYDLLWVDDGFTVRVLQDPQDTKLWAVVMEITLSWLATGKVRPPAEEGPLVQSVPGQWREDEDDPFVP